MNGQSVVRGPSGPVPPGGILQIYTTGVLLGLVPIFLAALREQHWISETAILLRLLFTVFLSTAVIAASRLLQLGSNNFHWPRGHVWNFFGYGIISIAAVNFLYLKSLEFAPAGVAIVSVFAAAPTMTLFAAWVTKKVRPAKIELTYIGLIVSGCVLINYTDGWSLQYWWGIVLAAAAGACYGLYSIFGKTVCKAYPAPTLLFWQFAFAGVATMAVYCLFLDCYLAFYQLGQLFTTASPKVWQSVLGLGFLATFLPYLFYGLGLKNGLDEKPATATALTLIESVSVTVLAWYFLGQNLGLYQIVGCALVLGAALGLSRVANRSALTIVKNPTA